jgi:hypothetical protein
LGAAAATGAVFTSAARADPSANPMAPNHKATLHRTRRIRGGRNGAIMPGAMKKRV